MVLVLSKTTSQVFGSRPSVGSSSSTTDGLVTSARANSTIRRCPPDRSAALSLARAAMTGNASASSSSRRLSARRSRRIR